MLALVALSACATTRGGGGGDGAATTTVRRQLAAAAELARSQGYTQAASEPALGALNHGVTETVGLTLNEGRQYLLVGVCDGDCSDMDLRLISPSGAPLAQDVASDDTPVLLFTAAASGQHRVQVVMAACSQNPCYYGVALYAK